MMSGSHSVAFTEDPFSCRCRIHSISQLFRGGPTRMSRTTLLVVHHPVESRAGTSNRLAFGGG